MSFPPWVIYGDPCVRRRGLIFVFKSSIIIPLLRMWESELNLAFSYSGIRALSCDPVSFHLATKRTPRGAP